MTNAHARAPTRAQLLNRVGGLAQGTYRLVGVLMYARGYHFVADVLDVCERRWLRYDGMVADGVGQPIEPTGGAMMHGHGCGRRYYPTLAVYAREAEGVL
jgi:hypothetical protein